MVMGDFNDVPVGDSAFVKRDKVYPKKYSLLKYLANKMLDTLRVAYPFITDTRTGGKTRSPPESTVPTVPPIGSPR
jgi:hypothetical protein